MNCKPGDLAVIVRANKDPRWLGRIVRVIQKFAEEEWVTDPLPTGFVAVRDRALRPIRDQPGEDEMIRIAGLPQDSKELA